MLCKNCQQLFCQAAIGASKVYSLFELVSKNFIPITKFSVGKTVPAFPERTASKLSFNFGVNSVSINSSPVNFWYANYITSIIF